MKGGERSSGGYLLIIPPLQHPTSHTEKHGKKTSKMERGQSVKQVLCVNTELCANAGGEVRGDLEDAVLLA